MIPINRFFFGFINQLRKVYLNSKFYDKKISKIDEGHLNYKPSPHLLSSLIKYQKKKFKIEDFSIDEIQIHKNFFVKDYKYLKDWPEEKRPKAFIYEKINYPKDMFSKITHKNSIFIKKSASKKK